MKSEINRTQVTDVARKPFKKNQLVKFTRGSSEVVAMLLENEDSDGHAKVICLYSKTNETYTSWWEVGEVTSATVEIWELFTDSLTLSN